VFRDSSNCIQAQLKKNRTRLAVCGFVTLRILESRSDIVLDGSDQSSGALLVVIPNRLGDVRGQPRSIFRRLERIDLVGQRLKQFESLCSPNFIGRLRILGSSIALLRGSVAKTEQDRDDCGRNH
jgi:hypothetical protein